jgi:peptidoglycan/LPS O-acetylase OafA/YrhL
MQTPVKGKDIQPVISRSTGVGGGVRLRQIDSLRAFAVIAVLIHHFLPAERITSDFMTFGLLGVRFFFVLSGFLITGILIRGQTIGTFYIRRALRILPAYYACLLVVILAGVPDARQYALWHILYLSHCLFVFVPGSGLQTSHFWSLAVEEQFYLVWPWLVLKTPARHLWKLAVAAILVTILFKAALAYTVGGHIAGGSLPFACLDSLGLGALLAVFSHDERLKPYRDRFLRAALASGSLIVLAQAVIFVGARGYRILLSTYYLGVSLIFVWFVGKAADGKLWKVIEIRPLLYVGKISYGVYLWHNFMPALVIWLFGYRPPALVLAGLSTLLTFAVAATSWKFLESPLNAMKDRLAGGVRTVRTRALENSAGGI